MGRKEAKKHGYSDGARPSKNENAGTFQRHIDDQKSNKDIHSAAHAPFIRKQVNPETAKYFAEIAYVLEGGDIDAEDIPHVCGNALEEARGKEVELATDHIISHTLQVLLEGCDVDNLCRFLTSCANNFALISTDRCGSHVAETALKSLSAHVDDEGFRSPIKETLTLICQDMGSKAVDVMCDCYGSHVLRSLLCFCKGVRLGSDSHAAKSAASLSRRMNLISDKGDANYLQFVHQGFPDLLKFLVSEMLKYSKTDISILQMDQYSSLVLQTALRLLAGEEGELSSVIPVILGCNADNIEDGRLISPSEVQNIKDLVRENTFSHLMEVIVEVAPDASYDEIFVEIFKKSLFEFSCHPSANFAVQALISHARSESHIEVICDELGPKFRDLLEMGKYGVVASVVAASQRLQTNEHKCSKALAASVTSANEPPKLIVPRILFLDDYFRCRDKSNWSWTSCSKANVMGSLILQSIYKYPSQLIEPYITSMTSMESEHVFEAVKDAGGARVIEAFVCSSAPDKQKTKLIGKLKGHFGDLAMHPSGSFTVAKCFSASGVTLREIIVSELAAVQKKLSNTRHGPGLMRSLDVDGYARHEEQWRLRQKSKISVHKDFLAEFGTEKPAGSSQEKTKKKKSSFGDDSKEEEATQATDVKKLRQEIESSLASFVPHEGSNDKKEKKRKRKDDKSDKRKSRRGTKA